MAKAVTVVVNQDADEAIIQELAACLRANDSFSKQLRDFADCLEKEQRVQGINWHPQAGQILICHFGLGFRSPEMVKTRPVMVVSPKVMPWTKLCIVLPISSKAPNPVLGHHYRLPDGLVPDGKYEEAWIKGDTIMAVSCHRLDRIKTGFRTYTAPQAPADVLKGSAALCFARDRHAFIDRSLVRAYIGFVTASADCKTTGDSGRPLRGR